MKNSIVSEAPSRYGGRRVRITQYRGNVVLYGVSKDTFSRLVNETGGRTAQFAYDNGRFEIKAMPGDRVTLQDVNWDTFLKLLRETGNRRKARFAYDNGALEIMSPHYLHGNSEFGIGQAVAILAEEFGKELLPAGNLTCLRVDLHKAMEPDGCFYIQNYKVVRGLDDIDLDIHPPPDLMVEVDITTDSSDKLEFCRELGVREHWRYKGERLEIRVLLKGKYSLVMESPTFPGVPLARELPRFIKSGRKGLIAMCREFRCWVQAELRKNQAPRRAGKKRP